MLWENIDVFCALVNNIPCVYYIHDIPNSLTNILATRHCIPHVCPLKLKSTLFGTKQPKPIANSILSFFFLLLSFVALLSELFILLLETHWAFFSSQRVGWLQVKKALWSKISRGQFFSLFFPNGIRFPKNIATFPLSFPLRVINNWNIWKLRGRTAAIKCHSPKGTKGMIYIQSLIRRNFLELINNFLW